MYSEDVRAMVIRIYRTTSQSITDIHKSTGIAKSTISSWLRETITIVKHSQIGFYYKCDQAIKDFIEAGSGDCRARDIRLFIRKKFNKSISLTTIRRYIRKLRISYKKMHPEYCNDLEKKRIRVEQFKKLLKTIPIEDIICLDESGFHRRMYRGYGYAPIGKKCAPVRRPERRKKNLLLAISMTQILPYKIISENYNGDLFREYLEHQLLPSCKGKYILMDNLSFHASYETRKLIEDSDNIPLFIPPYSPNFNPIENVFHSIKNQMREYLFVNESVIADILSSLDCSMLRNMYHRAFTV